MKPQMISTQDAMSQAAKLSHVGAVCHYNAPLTTQAISSMNGHGSIISCPYFNSAVSAAIGSELAGQRTIVFSSVLNSNPDGPYMRLPFVIANVSRRMMSASQDQSDILQARDSGYMIFMPENNLEFVESVIQAYKIGEDPKVLLPSIVNIDLAYISESVILPHDSYTRRFLSLLKLPFGFGKKTSYFNPPTEDYVEYVKQQNRAMKNAVPLFESTSLLWKKNFRRSLNMVEPYHTEDAELVLVVAGYHSQTAKAAVNTLRSQGKKVGLLRLRVIRPWPGDQIKELLKNAKKVAILDRSVDIGHGGITHSEIMPSHHFCSSYISFKHLSEQDLINVFGQLEKSIKPESIWI